MLLSAALDGFRNSTASAPACPWVCLNDLGYKSFEPGIHSLAMCLWAGHCNLCADLSKTNKQANQNKSSVPHKAIARIK